MVQVVLFWVVLVIVGVAFFRGKSPEQSAQQPPAAAQPAADTAAQEAAKKEAAATAERERLAKACEGDKARVNWECFMTVDQMATADVTCQKAVSRRAAIDVKWESNFFTRSFGATVRDPNNPNIVRMSTDKFQMQNSLGAWVRHRAICEWDMVAEKAKVILLEPGNLKF